MFIFFYSNKAGLNIFIKLIFLSLGCGLVQLVASRNLFILFQDAL